MEEEIQNGGALVSLSIQAGINPSVPFLLLWLFERFRGLTEAEAKRLVDQALSMAIAGGKYQGLGASERLGDEEIPTIPGIGVGTGTTERYVYGVEVTATSGETGESRSFPVQLTSGANLVLQELEELAKEAITVQVEKYPKGFKEVRESDPDSWIVSILSVAKGK